MSYCYSGLGYNMRLTEDNYIPQDGEVLFDHYPVSEEELRTAFPGRQAAQEAEELLRLSNEARSERDRQLREVYDRGTQMVRRELEMTSDPSYITLLTAKQTELHEYARLLQGIPEQSGFPVTIVWPTIPTETLE